MPSPRLRPGGEPSLRLLRYRSLDKIEYISQHEEEPIVRTLPINFAQCSEMRAPGLVLYSYGKQRILIMQHI